LGSSSQFTLQQFLINPTNVQTFPWLSRIASQYDQWEPNGIVFEFVSTSSDFNGASQSLGVVVMATDYDPYDPDYTSKQQMENADYSNSAKPSSHQIHGIECEMRERPTRVLYTSTNNGIPLTSTVMGTFNIATQGCSDANITLGELWVSYDITFYKKQLLDTGADLSKGPSLEMWNSPVTDDGPWLTLPFTTQRTITVTQSVGSGTTVNLNNSLSSGRYMLQIRVTYTDAPPGDLTITSFSSCSLTQPVMVSQAPLGGFRIYTAFVDVTAPSASFFLPALGLESGIQVKYGFVIQVPNGILL
jgi:hypothetical protein